MTTLVTFSTTPIVADVVWPAVVLERRILSVIPITVGLVVEWLALWLGGFGLSWKKAAGVDLVMNTVSTVAGIPVIPLGGFLWELFPGILLFKIFHAGTFNPGTWLATIAIAILATTAIEAVVLKLGFRIALGYQRLGVLCAANVVSVALAFVSLWTDPPKF